MRLFSTKSFKAYTEHANSRVNTETESVLSNQENNSFISSPFKSSIDMKLKQTRSIEKSPNLRNEKDKEKIHGLELKSNSIIKNIEDEKLMTIVLTKRVMQISNEIEELEDKFTKAIDEALAWEPKICDLLKYIDDNINTNNLDVFRNEAKI